MFGANCAHFLHTVFVLSLYNHNNAYCVCVCVCVCRSCFWAPSCSWRWTVPGASWTGSAWPWVRPAPRWIGFSFLQTLHVASKAPPPYRPVVLDAVPQRHALAEEPGGGAADGGAGVPGLHAAHAGAVCWAPGRHLHLPAVLWRG